MKYKIKDPVWIHMGERKLTPGRVVHIFTLDKAGRDFYVIEIETGIDNVYEVRDFDQISPDEQGPINLFRKLRTDAVAAQRLLKKIGILLPTGEPNPEVYSTEFTGDGHDGMGSVAEEPVKPEKLPGKKRYYARRRTAKSSQS